MKKKMKRFEEGGYTGDDEIVKYRMGMIDAKGNPIKKDSEPAGDDSPAGKSSYGEENASPETKGTAPKASKPAPKPAVKSEFKALTNKDEEGNKLPTDVKKPFIAIPKNAAGMQQYRDDAESPMGKLFRAITGSKSQRTAAAEKKMKSGGSVKSSASSRGDGCAQRGKTKGRMV